MKRTLLGAMALFVAVGVLLFGQTTTEVEEDPLQWQMMSGSVFSEVTNSETDEETYTSAPAMFLYNARTGTVYRHFSTCNAAGYTQRECFANVAIDLSHKGLTGFYISPEPSEGGLSPAPSQALSGSPE